MNINRQGGAAAAEVNHRSSVETGKVRGKSAFQPNTGGTVAISTHGVPQIPSLHEPNAAASHPALETALLSAIAMSLLT
jgi:hypothetical protein